MSLAVAGNSCADLFSISDLRSNLRENDIALELLQSSDRDELIRIFSINGVRQFFLEAHREPTLNEIEQESRYQNGIDKNG